MKLPPGRRAIMLLTGSLLVILLSHIFLSLADPSLFSTPFDASLQDGARVSHAGLVEDTKTTWSGGHRILTVSGVKVFIPRGVSCPDLRIGDYVTVYGVLSTFDGAREIVIQRDADIVPAERR